MLGHKAAVSVQLAGPYEQRLVGAFMVDTELEHRLRNLSKLLKAARQNYEALNNILTLLKADAEKKPAK